MIDRRSSWIRGRTVIRLAGGNAEKYGWKIIINISKLGEILSPIDNPVITFEDPVKMLYRKKDRKWFVNVCGKEYMADKEVDHEWGSNPIWTRIVSPTENGGRQRVQSYNSTSFVETEEWLQDLYPGKRR